MSSQFEYVTGIDSRDADGQGRCRPSALLGHLQQAATLAAEDSGFGRAMILERYDAFWILARVWYELERPLRWQEELTVTTWHRGGRAGTLYRDFDLSSGGRPVGRAVSLWALVRRSDRRILNLSRVPELTDTAAPRPGWDRTLGRLRMPEQMDLAERRLMHYSDADINAHVNNTRYADFACDAIRAERLPAETYIRSMQISYNAECRPGETIDLFVREQEGGFLVRGADEAGTDRFDAQLIPGRDIS